MPQKLTNTTYSVSYTHLDVYKRQEFGIKTLIDTKNFIYSLQKIKIY